jgi:nucleotide-binding universal stress UspA family protein
MATNIVLYRDATLPVPLQDIADGLNAILKSCRVSLGRELVEIPGATVNHNSYDSLPPQFVEEATNADVAVVATRKRYDNNFFYEYSGSIVIISFSDWDRLTALPEANGLVLMIAEILVDAIRLGESHGQSRGCVNDFRPTKTDIDFGLRAAFVCEECLRTFERSKPATHRRALLEDVQTILNEVSDSSRRNLDITERWRTRVLEPISAAPLFEVFLCHNSNDKSEVRALNKSLKKKDVRTWFDEDELRPGQPWQPELEREIRNVKTAAIIVGSSGRGPWQDFETRAFLAEFAERQCPLIPVILPTCTCVPELPIFLKQFTWVDFRSDSPDPLQRLLWGIRGRK